MDIDRYDDMRKILVLRTIVECGTIQKAASALKVTPSAISQTLKTLETKLSHPLFIRDQGKLQPTAQCGELLEKAKPAFLALDEFFGEKAKHIRLASLDLGAYESLAIQILPQFSERLKADHPGIRMNFQISRTAELLKGLRSGKLCTALITETDQLDGMNVIEVAEEKLGIFVSSDSAEMHQQPGFTQKLGFGVLATGADGALPYMKRFLAQLGNKPNIMVSADSFELLARAAICGVVASVLPRRVAQRHMPYLTELKGLNGTPFLDTGKHNILLVSQDRCDSEEAKYLARVVRSCLLA